jgi:hypothetical protein
MESLKFVKWDEALSLIASVDDLAQKQLVNIFFTEMVKLASIEKVFPSGEFDVHWAMRAFLNMSQKKDMLLAILNGEDLRMWDESGQDIEP